MNESFFSKILLSLMTESIQPMIDGVTALPAPVATPVDGFAATIPSLVDLLILPLTLSLR